MKFKLLENSGTSGAVLDALTQSVIGISITNAIKIAKIFFIICSFLYRIFLGETRQSNYSTFNIINATLVDEDDKNVEKIIIAR